MHNKLSIFYDLLLVYTYIHEEKPTQVLVYLITIIITSEYSEICCAAKNCLTVYSYNFNWFSVYETSDAI